MIKKLKIEPSFDNIYVWGLSSGITELQLVLLINRCLHIELRRSICVMNRSFTPSCGFQTFTYLNEDDDLSVRYVLFINRVEGYTLFTSCSQFDYLLVVMGVFSDHEIRRTTVLLRSVAGINALIPVSVDSLRNDKEYLLLFE